MYGFPWYETQVIVGIIIDDGSPFDWLLRWLGL